MLIVVEDATITHDGTICSGSVEGTVEVGNNNFVTINNKLIVTDSGRLIVPEHGNPPCFPSPNIASHDYPINNFQQSFVTINNEKIVLLNDNYSIDSTIITNQGSNNFVEISI